MGKQKTIRDVAQLAGVSIATASRVLNDSGYPVRPQLRQRVKEAAEKLEYVPNTMAQALRREVCKDIALIVPNLSNPFYLQAVLGVGEALATSDYSMIFCNTTHDPERERSFLRQLYERQVKGVILSSVSQDNAQLVKKYIQKGMKFVLLDQMLSNVESYTQEVPEFSYRLAVKAGLTGYAQIAGKYNTAPKEKMMMDLMYIEDYSIWRDIKLLLQTVTVFFRSSESTTPFENADSDKHIAA